MYAPLWLLALAAARRGDPADMRRRQALRGPGPADAARRLENAGAKLEPPPALPFRPPAVLPVASGPRTAAAAVGDLANRLAALKAAAPPPTDNLAARLAALKQAALTAPALPKSLYEAAGLRPAPADEAPAKTADPLDTLRASLARTAEMTRDVELEAPDPLREAQRKAALKAMREREAKVAQFFDFEQNAPGAQARVVPREPSFAARQTRRMDARAAVVDVSRSPSAAPAAFDGAFDWSADAVFEEEPAAAVEEPQTPVDAVPAGTTEEAAPAPRTSFAGLVLALVLALSLPLCVLALAASAVWRRPEQTAPELASMDKAAKRVHRDARAARVEAEELRAVIRKLRRTPEPKRPSVATLLEASRHASQEEFERVNCIETPLVKEVRFGAQTPASAVVSESDADSPAEAVHAPRRKLQLDPRAPPPPRRGAYIAWVLLAAFVARDVLMSRHVKPTPAPKNVWARATPEPTYVYYPEGLVENVAPVPAIMPPVASARTAIRPFAIVKAAIAPIAFSAALTAFLPPGTILSLLMTCHAKLRVVTRAAAAAGAFIARRRSTAGAPLSAMHFSAP